MNLRISGLLVIAAFVAACLLGSGQSLAQDAYITDSGSNNVSVIDTASNTVIATIPVGGIPVGVAISPNGRRVYVANPGTPPGFNTVQVIDTASNTVIATIPVGSNPSGVAVTPDGSRVYVANFDNTVSVIDTASNTVIATIPGLTSPIGVAVAPDGSKVYVTDSSSPYAVSVIDTATNTVTATILVAVGASPHGVAVVPDGNRVYVSNFSGSLSVIDATTNTVIATIPVGEAPIGVAVTPDGSRVYVANEFSASVSAIDTASNTVIDTIPLGLSFPNGTSPVAFGIFIQPAPRFAGTPGYSNCHGQSVAALARKYHGLNSAAAALGFSSVKALQNAILAFAKDSNLKSVYFMVPRKAAAGLSRNRFSPSGPTDPARAIDTGMPRSAQGRPSRASPAKSSASTASGWEV